jgi:hypothetical protein
MNIWILIMLATSPIAFLISFQFSYRWALYDSGGGSKLFWKLLRTDLHCSIPGRYGDIARITRARGWIKKYADMGNSTTGMFGIKKPFKEILKERQYQKYEHLFMRPKWWLWSKMAASLVWPIALPLWLVANVLALIWYLINPPQYTRM